MTRYKNLTNKEAADIGRSAKDNYSLAIGGFAAELVGESYPFSKDMSKIVFDSYTDEALGRKLAQWFDDARPKI